MVTENFGNMNLKDSKKIQKLKAMEERLLKTNKKTTQKTNHLYEFYTILCFLVLGIGST